MISTTFFSKRTAEFLEILKNRSVDIDWILEIFAIVPSPVRRRNQWLIASLHTILKRRYFVPVFHFLGISFELTAKFLGPSLDYITYVVSLLLIHNYFSSRKGLHFPFKYSKKLLSDWWISPGYGILVFLNIRESFPPLKASFHDILKSFGINFARKVWYADSFIFKFILFLLFNMYSPL